MKLGAMLANVAWSAANAYAYQRFRRALRDVKTAQTEILLRNVKANAETRFGRQHAFSKIVSPPAYRDRVPLTTYDDYEPYIEQIACGQPRVLTREPVHRFEISGGSTGAAKRIPHTGALQAEFRRAVFPWVFDLTRRNPRLLAGPSYWAITPALRLQGFAASRVPVGFDDDSAYLGGTFKRLVDATLAVPPHVAQIRDVNAFRHVTLLYLLKAAELRLVSVWHPSFLSLLWAYLMDHWDELLMDLRRGYSREEPSVRIVAHPERASALSRLSPLTPAAIWRHLHVISCWGDGNAGFALKEVRTLFPECSIQAKGLIATEGIVSIPFAGTWPLAVTSHFLEFLAGDGSTRFAWELETGAHYSVVITTGGGLYRYQLHDEIEVVGRLMETPCIRFVHKEDHVSDLCGEKLSEGFVSGVVRTLLQRWEVQPKFAMLAPRCDPHDGERYVLYLELDPRDSARFDAIAAAVDLERELCSAPHYEYCVRLGQLRTAEVCTTAPGAYARYAMRLESRGQRLGDVKPLALSPLSGWDPILRDRNPEAVKQR